LEKYPGDWVEEAMGRVRGLRADNSRKNFDYVEGILEGFALERAVPVSA